MSFKCASANLGHISPHIDWAFVVQVEQSVIGQASRGLARQWRPMLNLPSCQDVIALNKQVEMVISRTI
ncbi:MAG: hypothetical protein P8J33_09495 [Pirellulaceae bacterium]|nr:hypothetical protein [Pirellulaceae bacterium]